MNVGQRMRQPGDRRHMTALIALAIAVVGLVAVVASHGFDYYGLPVTDRPFHPMHTDLRPSGRFGLRLGFLAALLFLGVYMYPLRKRIKPLQKIGKTKHWLDVHVLLGLTAPLIVTLHSSLKVNGLVGMAYWIMVAIVVSGIAGRYLYSQIPKTMNAAEISLKELEEQADELSGRLAGQRLFAPEALNELMTLPSRQEVEHMPLLQAIGKMIVLDVRRPFQVAALRRTVLSGGSLVWTLGGLLASRREDLEEAVDAVQRRSWLTAKILFLNRASDVFHLWHVVHRPFSYSFVLIVIAHVVLVGLMGYL